MDPLRTLFRHHAWATLSLFDHCAALPPDRLTATVPGTYGTVEKTLIHLVGADQRYLANMDGQAAAIRIRERENPSLADARAAMELQAVRWESLVDRAPELDVTVPADDEDPVTPQGEDLMFLQAIHHGNDHRTQVCTILGALGLEVPDLSGWQYWRDERRG
jgi:uncharacterized damage-inducible protein DinB